MRDRIYGLLVRLGLVRQEVIYYIGGSDILPPPLKGAEERAALEALEQGDESAKQLLIERNLRLVVFIARRFENTGVNLEDLISIGTIGLIKAIGTYRRFPWMSQSIWTTTAMSCSFPTFLAPMRT